MTTIETRICRICGEEKPITEFATNRLYKDGYDTRCKVCKNKASSEWYHKNKKYATQPTNSELSKFTPRELIEELRARGYKGTLTFTKQIIL